jgi:hypothetical protein
MISGGAQGHNRATIRIQTRISLRSTFKMWEKISRSSRSSASSGQVSILNGEVETDEAMECGRKFELTRSALLRGRWQSSALHPAQIPGSPVPRPKLTQSVETASLTRAGTDGVSLGHDLNYRWGCHGSWRLILISATPVSTPL